MRLEDARFASCEDDGLGRRVVEGFAVYASPTVDDKSPALP